MEGKCVLKYAHSNGIVWPGAYVDFNIGQYWQKYLVMFQTDFETDNTNIIFKYLLNVS